MRRLQPSTPPTLDEPTILLLLLGHGARPMLRDVSIIRQLQFMSDFTRCAHLWREHEVYLLAEAARRGIARPFDAELQRPAWFGEVAISVVEKFPQRYGRL